MTWPRLLAAGLLALGLSAWHAATAADAIAAAATPAAADTAVVPVPAWTGPVMDLASALTPAQIRTLTGQMQDLERTHGAQLFVLIVPSTGSDAIEHYARRVFDQWGVGRKDIDDGVLLLVALQDRHLRIEVGYGLEGAVTDVDAGRIIRERITPRFAAGDIDGGLQAGVSALSSLIAGEPLPPPATAAADAPEDDPIQYVMLLFLSFFALVMPLLLGTVLMAGFTFLVTGSPVWAIVGALAGLTLGLIGRKYQVAKRLPRGGRGGGGRGGGGFGGGFGGGLGGGGGFGGGRGASGGGSGGGGSGGGGGASGSW